VRRLIRIAVALASLGVIAAFGAAAVFFVLVMRDLPEIYSLRDYRPNLITRVMAVDGTEIASISRERRIVVPIEEIPEHTVQAFISAEDEAFYEHEGIDYTSILRAAWANVRAGGVAQGGSTITQQVAKTFLLTADRTVVRKLKDMVLARRIEQNLQKNEILYLYLNQIYLGSGAYGVESAARTYFDKPVAELDLAESALIAGLVPAPSRYTPRKRPEVAKRRQLFVLRQMLQNGFISEEERAAAVDQPLAYVTPQRDEAVASAAYFTEEVRRHLVERYGEKRVLTGGLTALTTLDVHAQFAAQRAVKRGLRAHDRRAGYRGPIRLVPEEEWPAVMAELSGLDPNAPADADAEAGADPNEPLDPFDLQALAEAIDEAVAEAEPQPEMPPVSAAPPEEQNGDVVRALVTEVDDENEVVTLALGNGRTTQLELEDLKWAREPDPSRDGAIPRVRRVSQALKLGYLVDLERVGERVAEGADQLEDPLAGVVPKYALFQEPLTQGALLSMELATGEVRAMIGGYSFGRSQFNRAVQMHRQPGSAFKPIIYAAALERGYTPASIVYDTPIVWEDPNTGVAWKPRNYSTEFYGPITLRHALAHSRNIATIKILREIGIKPVIEMAHAVGVDADLEPNLSLALGTSEVTLTEIVKTYATFAAGGRVIEPVFVLEVRDRDGELLEENVPLMHGPRLVEPNAEPEPPDLEEIAARIRASIDRLDDEEALPEGYGVRPVTAYLMTDLLRSVVQDGTGFRVKRGLRGRSIAGKTGTTDDQFDAWFIGYSPSVVTGAWVGYDVARTLGTNETGSRAASPIFIEYMQHALDGRPREEFSVPSGVQFVKVDEKTGLLFCPSRPDQARFMPFAEGTEPSERAPCGDQRNGRRQRRPRLD